MKKKRAFWDDESLGQKLDAIPENEMSTIIRMALRQYFGISNTKPVEQLSSQDAKSIARELMLNLKVRSEF